MGLVGAPALSFLDRKAVQQVKGPINPVSPMSFFALVPPWRARGQSDLHNQIIKSLKGLPWQGEDPRRLLQSLSLFQKPRTSFL